MNDNVRKWTIRAACFVLILISMMFSLSLGYSQSSEREYQEPEALIEYEPHTQIPSRSMVVRKNSDGSVDLVEIERKNGRVNVYFHKQLPDASPTTLYEVFLKSPITVSIAEVDKDGIWSAHVIKRE